MIGKTISQYNILEKLGEGGMGVVYRARDTKLDRDIALKFLPPELTKDASARERFIHEAKAASALSHPNVCAIHDIQDHENQMFIVMDFVDGQTLREKQDSISFKQAIDIGIQVADGLAAAHEKGIVHRDIKPENIMIRKDGIAQVMDFGLAKLRGNVSRLTKEGSTVGTAGYMSPEQVQGQDTDHRSDIFSFGVLLYELLTGQLPFKGVHETALAYEIVNVDPAPMSSIKPDIDPHLDAIVLECLEKDPRERTQSIAQVSLDLKKYKRDTSRQRASRIAAARSIVRTSEGAQPLGGYEPSKGLPIAWIVAASVLFICAVTFGVMYFKRPPTGLQTISAYILPPEKLTFAAQSGGLGGGHLALSPDGSMLAFVAADSSGKTRLMVRALNALNAKEFPTTEGACYPFWSPDNRYVGFFQSGKMKKIEASGGPSVTICDAPNGRGGSWNQNGVIIFSNAADPIYEVPAAGGVAAAVTKLDTSRNEKTHRWPHFLPDGRHFLYFSRSSFGGVERKEDALVVGSLDGNENKRLMAAKGNVVYASGCLVYLRERTLMAQPFDAGKLETSGDAMPIAEPVDYDLAYNRALFSASQNGTLIYQSSSTQYGLQLEWFDRTGTSLGTIAPPADYGGVSLSPDGKRLAFDIYDYSSGNRDIWIYDIARGLKTRFTFDPSVDQSPVWSPDGSRIAFCSDRKEHLDLYQKTTSGAGVEEVLLESPGAKFPVDWSADGTFIAYIIYEIKKTDDVWILPVDPGGAGEDRMPFAFLQAESDEDVSQFSPDMRWISYLSNESGNVEVYVCPFIGADGRPTVSQSRKWQVSTNGVGYNAGVCIKWNRNGKELFYLSNDNKLMAADVKASGSTFDVGAIRPLFEVKAKGLVGFYDVTADGQKFLIGIQVGGQSVTPLTLVTNWHAELKRK
jgi:Tol biopolymer transport system component/tRNA A-37 threonylcarbamoyl transferase component Bud32